MLNFDKVQVNQLEIADFSNTLDFAHDENNIEVHYTGISYNKPSFTSFYKTNFNKKGQDTLWTLTNNLEAQFIDLTPGNYPFGVQASDSKGEYTCLLYTSPSPRDATLSRMPSAA